MRLAGRRQREAARQQAASRAAAVSSNEQPRAESQRPATSELALALCRPAAKKSKWQMAEQSGAAQEAAPGAQQRAAAPPPRHTPHATRRCPGPGRRGGDVFVFPAFLLPPPPRPCGSQLYACTSQFCTASQCATKTRPRHPAAAAAALPGRCADRAWQNRRKQKNSQDYTADSGAFSQRLTAVLSKRLG